MPCPIARGVKLKALLGGGLASKHAEAIEYKVKNKLAKARKMRKLRGTLGLKIFGTDKLRVGNIGPKFFRPQICPA